MTKPISQDLSYIYHAGFVGIPKAAMRNKKRSEKRIKARIQPSMGNGVKVEAIEMKDPSAVLRQQFQEAKNKKDKESTDRKSRVFAQVNIVKTASSTLQMNNEKQIFTGLGYISQVA
ncbi:PREDICTED: uncharacterized protein LOC107333354 isoform X1 [Acropora digitifera]|uniref:uncharacterized protein LOC107333354 isoform X1 n=1 Tax=Acropora digitifera TaxID=70779 RepID=UPI00077ADAE1|nr:PREDICTED: uncharacterized protein LOC107333354 isoform X1 [Acropora digitifera]